MEIDQLLNLLGDPGRYQSLLYVLLWLCNSTVAMNHLIMSVFGAALPHSCVLPNGVQKNGSTPFKTKDGQMMYSSCEVYTNYSSTSAQTISCPLGWHFAVSGKPSIQTEWTLVCEKKYMISLATTIYFAGVMIGGLIFGAISDRFGRRLVALGAMYAHIIFGIGISFIHSYEGFVALRFFQGMLMQGLQSSAYILSIEMTPMRHRPTVAGLFGVFWAVGTIWMASLAWMIKDWRYIQLAMCIPSILTISYIWIVPQSIRWLATHYKKEEALVVAKRFAKINKITLPENIDLHVKTTYGDKKATDYNITDLFKTPKIRKRALLMFYIWLTASIGYYGLSLNVAPITGNIYLNIFISCLIELPASAVVIFTLRIFGRRYPLCFFYVVGGVCCITAGTISNSTASTALALMGKFFIFAAFGTIFLFTSELFPTIIRNVAMGGCTFWTRFGGLIASQLLLLGQYTFKALPFLIFGTLALLAGVFALILPETKGITLPDTVEEVEGLGEEEHKLQILAD